MLRRLASSAAVQAWQGMIQEGAAQPWLAWRLMPAVDNATRLRSLLPPCCALADPYSIHQVRHFAVKRKRKSTPTIVPKAIIQRRVDHEIDAPEVRLVADDANAIVPIADALAQARAQQLQLVEVAKEGPLSVCRIMDYSAYIESAKRAQRAQTAVAQQGVDAVSKIKGLRLGWNIAEHDLDTKKKQMQQFLDKGRQVAVSVTYDHRYGKWKEQYPKAVQVAKTIWTEFHVDCTSWFDYSESGNKQICVMYTRGAPVNKQTATPPWEAGSKPPPFLLRLQAEAQERAQQQGNHKAMRRA